MYIDSHFHMNVYERYEGMLSKAIKLLNKYKILVVANTVDPDSYKSTTKIAKKTPYVLPCFGIHPQVAHEYLDKLDHYEACFNQALAYGEIGLDHSFLKDKSQYKSQYKLLEYFFTKAQEYDKFVVLHLDGAEEKGWELIKKYSLSKVIIHGYKGPLDTMKKLLGHGCYFSVGGNMIMEKFKPAMTDEEWIHFLTIVQKVPDNRLLVETDGPCRTELNPTTDAPRSMPTYIFDIGTQIAKLRKTTAANIFNLTKSNFCTLISESKTFKTIHQLLK